MDDEIPGGVWRIDDETRRALRLQGARTALRDGRYLEATVEAEELLDADPDHGEALRLVGEAALELGQPEVARLAFEDCLRVERAEADVYTGLAVARFELCDLAGAIDAARLSLAADPSSAEAHHVLGLALERAGADGAADHVAAAERLDPDLYPPRLRLEASDWERARTRALLQVDPDLADFWSAVPVCWEDLPDLDELRSYSPPIRPTVGGLYQGVPPEDADPRTVRPSALRLYRRNLALSVDLDDLVDELVHVLAQEASSWGLTPSDDDPPALDRSAVDGVRTGEPGRD